MRSRGTLAVLPVILGSLLAASAAQAATISVDDDRQDCTAAAFTSVQDAIDAAAPGDTVTICPGHYVEGTGDANSNAVTVDKTLTLKGAGADLVTISPRRYDGNDGVIAEDANDDGPGAPQSIRHPRGNILTAVGAPAIPVTVDISGITFSGNGVAAKAGVVFLDAEGSLVRSRVTDVVTSEMPGASDQPGGYRHPDYLGYGVAQVTAAQTAPVGAGPRTLALDNVRIDEYNRIGVLIDGGRDAGSPVSPSGLDLRATIVGSQIVGRNLCPDAHVDGDCGRFTPPENPDPKPLTTGPLMGQDGVRIAAGARGAIISSSITQNLVQGEGAPVRGQATNNQNLRRGAGIRLVGADAANSSVTRSNIVDNAYGIVNAGPDDGSDSSSRLPAENNWWGLRSPITSGGPQPEQPNTGPAISPATNPPYPENPVNGAPTSDGEGVTSTTVDFWPYRNGQQSDPNRGQYPILTAPIPVNDAGPAVSVRPERPSYRRGETVKLIAEATDDFGIRRITFFDGATEVGSDDSPPYEAAFTIPPDAPCGTNRDVAATAEDSLGQTATGTATLEVVCDAPAGGGGAGPDLVGPSVELPENLRRIRRVGETVTARASSPNGIAYVDLLLGARRVCRDREAPYRCRITPLSSEIGSQTVRAIATDREGLTAQDLRQVVVPRFKPRELMIEVARKQLPGNRVLKTVTARVLQTKGVKRATACRNGRVTAVVRQGLITLADRQVKLDRRCRAKIMSFSAPHNLSRRFKYKVIAHFGGTTVMVPARKTRRFS